jgi:hypothetical protein
MASATDVTLPSMVRGFVLRVVEQARPGQVYTYICRGVDGTTEYVATPGEEWPEPAERRVRSLVLAIRTPRASLFHTLEFRRTNGAWVQLGG